MNPPESSESSSDEEVLDNSSAADNDNASKHEQDINLLTQKLYDSIGDDLESHGDIKRPGVKFKGNVGFERTGVTHLVHAWHAQGRSGPNVCFNLFE
jgi:hypothetical protein